MGSRTASDRADRTDLRQRFLRPGTLSLDPLFGSPDNGGASGTEPSRIEALFSEQVGYATPKVDVRGAVFSDNAHILLVREIADAGRWTLPGGWADVNQPPSECVIREVREESGFEIGIRKLAAVYDRDRHGHVPPHAFHVYELFFTCNITGGAPRPGPETSEVAFFAADKVPSDLSLGRVQRHQIERMFEHWLTPALPTDFD